MMNGNRITNHIRAFLAAGMHLTACEIDAEYYEAACARIKRETSQGQLFSPHNH